MIHRKLSRQFHGFLFAGMFLAVLAYAGAGPASAAKEKTPSYQELNKQYQKAFEKKDYAKALEIAEEMYPLVEEPHITVCYNIAALYNLLGKKGQAYEWLEFCLDAGYQDYRGLMSDEKFAGMKDEDRFKKMLRKKRIDGYLAMLERADRDDFQMPEKVMEALALKPGERVADIGAGSGYFTLRAAKAVGPTGIVWAIDIRQEMLDYIAKRVEEEKLENIRPMLVFDDDPQLPQGKVDTILMVDTWHYIRKPEYAKKLRAGLAPGGRVVIIDYTPKPFEERPWGPPPEQQTSREELDAHFAEAGLKPAKEHAFLTEQYFVEYKAE
jgi:ubiquinone/menaquinone biosynthesis C-methylase UbiE